MLTGEQLARRVVAGSPIILVPLVPMLAVDLYFVVRVGRFDHDETVKYFDQAESWLGWKGPLVRVLTLGIVNPRKMVDEEVKKSLTEMQSTLTRRCGGCRCRSAAARVRPHHSGQSGQFTDDDGTHPEGPP